MPSTHSRLPQSMEKGEIHVNILHPSKYIFLHANYCAQWAQQQKQAPRAAKIDNVLFIENVIQSPPTQSIPSRPHSNAEKGGQGVIILYPPKYKFSPPQSVPQPAQWRETVSSHPGRLFPTLLTLVYSAIKPAQQCPDPALQSGTLGSLSSLPVHPAAPRLFSFFGW